MSVAARLLRRRQHIGVLGTAVAVFDVGAVVTHHHQVATGSQAGRGTAQERLAARCSASGGTRGRPGPARRLRWYPPTGRRRPLDVDTPRAAIARPRSGCRHGEVRRPSPSTRVRHQPRLRPSPHARSDRIPGARRTDGSASAKNRLGSLLHCCPARYRSSHSSASIGTKRRAAHPAASVATHG